MFFTTSEKLDVFYDKSCNEKHAKFINSQIFMQIHENTPILSQIVRELAGSNLPQLVAKRFHITLLSAFRRRPFLFCDCLKSAAAYDACQSAWQK
jgi:hypothetical protein